MNIGEYKQLKRWIGLTPEYEAMMVDFGPLVEPYVLRIVDQFYERVMAEPKAMQVMGDGEQVNRLRPHLAQWLRDLFCGQYDHNYYRMRARIGRRHVEVELPQQFMFSGMAVLRRELKRLLMTFDVPRQEEAIDVLGMLLDLELAIMLDTYRDNYVAQVRAADRRAAQRRMAEMQHMAHIGQLAASLAHEIKNPLAGISGAVQVLSHEMDRDNPHYEVMQEILRQIDRLDSAVKDLLTYSGPKPPSLVLSDVGKTVRSALTLLAEDPIVKAVTVVCNGFEKGIEARLDPSQFGQVVANLVINAAQACHGEGQVTLAISRDRAGVQICIRDTGEGMSDETLKRAWEPFFTTKTRGTGLGLPICKRVIEEHGSQLQIESSPGVGTTVTIMLPNPDTAGHQDPQP